MRKAMTNVSETIDDFDRDEYMTLTENSVLHKVQKQINKFRAETMIKIGEQHNRIYGDNCTLY